jgi:hypothetical protein
MPYTAVRVEGWGRSPDEQEARGPRRATMKGKLMLVAGLVVLVVVAGVMAFGLNPAEATSDPAPEEVVATFYEWYLDFIGEGESRQNPLVERAYRSSEHLSGEFVAKVDELLASSEGIRFDPFLLAQDVPVKVEVGEAVLAGDRASVEVEMFWGGNPSPSERVVTLEMVDGEWKISGVGFAE